MQPGESNIEGNNVLTVDWLADGRPDAATIAAARGKRPETTLDPEIAETFRRDGVALMRGAFVDWVAPLRRGLARNLAAPEAFAFPCESTRQGDAGRFFDSYCNWRLIPEYTAFVLHSPAAAIAGQAMGARRAQLFHEHAFVKEPGTQRATPWHQDLPYYGVDGTRTVSVYIALDPAPEDVAVRFVAGSHRSGTLYQPRIFLDGQPFNVEDASFAPVPDIDADPGAYDIRAFALEPGDAVLFDFRTLHGTTDAPVRRRRSAFSTRWLGDDVCYRVRPGETSPPFPGIGLADGAPMREDWFPVLWAAED